MNVAVIDTSLNYDMLSQNIEISKIVSLRVEQSDTDQYVVIDDGKYINNDRISHGTCVVNTVRKYYKGEKLNVFMYDIFDSDNQTAGILIAEALKLILKEDIDIVVISLVCNPVYKSSFDELKEQIIDRGIVVLCASDNNKKNNFPASLSYIYGVGGKDNACLGTFDYNTQKNIQFTVNCENEFINCNKKLSVFGGTSKGTPMIAGLLLNYLEENGKLKLGKFLKNDFNEIVIKNGPFDRWTDKEVYAQVLSVFGISDNDSYMFDVPIAWSNYQNIEQLIFLFEKYNCADTVYTLCYNEFKSINNIIATLEKLSNR